jgi:hypothetical protein
VIKIIFDELFRFDNYIEIEIVTKASHKC